MEAEKTVSMRSWEFFESVISELDERWSFVVSRDGNRITVTDEDAQRVYLVEWNDNAEFKVDGQPITVGLADEPPTGDCLVSIVFAIINDMLPPNGFPNGMLFRVE